MSSTVAASPPAAAGPSVPVRHTVPSKGRVRVSEIWTSLPTANMIALRDFKARYKQSALGPLWLLLQPLGILGAFTVVFEGVAEVDTGGVPYALFALVGITVWTFVNASLAVGVRTHVINHKLIKLVPCSRVAYVTSAVTASLPNLAIPLVFTLIALPLLGSGLGLEALAFPAVLAWLIVFIWSATNFLAALNVRFRDIGNAVPFLLQGGIFLTPVAYPLDDATPALATVLAFNPLTGIIESWRWALLGAQPDVLALIVSGATTVLLAVGGWIIFRRMEPRFADVV